LISQGGKLDKDAFSLTNGLGKTVQREFFATSRESDTQLVFNQLKMAVMMTEQNRGISAFS
jgi:hypothetical protein